MQKEYVEQLEKQNEFYQNELVKALQKLEDAEKSQSLIDFLPTFVLYPYGYLKHKIDTMFIHQNIVSIYELSIDEIWRIINNSLLSKRVSKRQKSGIEPVGEFMIECWCLGSRATTYIISLHIHPEKSPQKIYNIQVKEIQVESHLCYDDESDAYYNKHVPKSPMEVLKSIYKMVDGYDIMRQYINQERLKYIITQDYD